MKLPKLTLLTSTLLAAHVLAAPITVDPLLSTDMAWDGQALPAHVQIVKTTIGAGQVKPVHQHNNLFCGYVLKGELTITKLGGNKDAAIFMPGDAFCEVLNVDHFGKAGEKSDVQVITFEVKN